MKNRRLFLSALLALVLCFTMFAVTGRADFGDFGGDSDYGGGWDSGWDSDDDDDDYDYDYDYNDSSPGFYGSDYSGVHASDGESIAMLALVVALLVIFFLIKTRDVRKKRKRKGKPQPVAAPGATPTSIATLRPMAEYGALDPGFNPEALKEQLSNRYVQFQNAWQAKDIAPLRPYLTDALYAQMETQLENNYRRTRQTNRVERIAVLGVDLMGWRQNAGADEIVARLRTRVVDYVVDDASGRVVRGSATAEKFMTYEWILTRAAGVVTGQTDGLTVHNCPNCGAVLNINQTARCEYCGSIVTVEAHEWALTNIKGLSQRTGG